MKIGSFFIGLVFSLCPINNAASEVIFEDDFDSQSDWEQTGSVTCDSGDCSATVPTDWSYYRSYGHFQSNTTPAGENTIQINSTEPRGGSGKSLIEYTECRGSWSNDGELTKTFSQGYSELYASVWVKFQDDWIWDSSAAQKMFRLFHWTGSGSVYEVFWDGNSSPISLVLFKQSSTWGWRHYPAIRCEPHLTNYYCDQDYDGDTLFPGTPTFAEYTDDGWHQIQMRTKLNTKTGVTWNNDGIYTIWIDGTLSVSKTNVQWRTSGTEAENLLNTVSYGGNSSNEFCADFDSGEEQYISFDDVVVSTTFIPFDTSTHNLGSFSGTGTFALLDQ